MYNEFDKFSDFRRQAELMKLCFWTIPEPGDIAIFDFYFNNPGSIYAYAFPNKIYDLVMFGRKHSLENNANYWNQRYAYSLLDRTCRTYNLNQKLGYVCWNITQYDPNDRTTISMEDWLEMWGYKVPAFPEQQ